MSALIVDLSNHRTTGPGSEGGAGAIVVEGCEDTVHLTLRDEDDRRPGADRSLTAAEARSLAAALVHFAAEVER